MATPPAARGRTCSPFPSIATFRGRARTVSGLVATGTTGRLDVRLSEGGEFEHPNGRFVSANYFDVLGVGAERGRVLGAADEGAAGTTPVAIVSDAYWRGRLGGASNVVGRTISVDGITLTIAGVAGRGFGGEVVERPTDIGFPSTCNRCCSRTVRPLPVAGRAGCCCSVAWRRA